MRHQSVLFGIVWAATVAAAASGSEIELDGNWNNEEPPSTTYDYVRERKEENSDRAEQNDHSNNADSIPTREGSSDEDQRAAASYFARSPHRPPTQVIQPYVVNLQDGSINYTEELTDEERSFDKATDLERHGQGYAADEHGLSSNSFAATRNGGVGGGGFGEQASVKHRKGLPTLSHNLAAGEQAGVSDEKQHRMKENRKAETEREMLVSLGKFSGPIVVPELDVSVKDAQSPTFRRNDTTDVIGQDRIGVGLNVPAENRYVATSSNILRPLQAGLMLINLPNFERINSSIDDQYQNYEDQEKQERTSEAPTVQSVEVQKSVELYHTAPVREIHYPIEYVPELVQPRPNRIEPNAYKSENEIVEESRNNALYRWQQNDFNNRFSHEKATHASENDRNRFEEREPDSPLFRGQAAMVDAVETRANLGGINEIVTELGSEENPASSAEQFQLKLALTENSLRLLNGESTSQHVGRQSFANTALTEAGKRIESKYVSLGPRAAYPVEKVIEKTVHVPHPIEIEKLVEKRVPYTVEKLIEKQVAIPQPYPVHVPIRIPVQIPVPVPIPVDRVVEKQIRIPHLYPVHVDRPIEKKFPFPPVQRFILQSHPIHVKPAQFYSAEKQMQLPITVEKVLEKVANREPYTAEMSRFLGSLSYPNSLQYEANYQQAVPWPRDSPISVHRQTPSQSKLYVSHGGHRSQLVPHSLYWKQVHATVATGKERSKEEYASKARQLDAPALAIQSKSFTPNAAMQQLQQLSNSGQLGLRKARQQESATGTFRQSKMEYGFKPPMVPSVQYDEKTAAKVE